MDLTPRQARVAGRVSTRRATRGAVEALERRVLMDGSVAINEVMYHPAAASAGGEADLEWVELHSRMAVDMDLSGWKLRGGIDYDFPDGTVMRGGAFLVVASNPVALEAATGYADAVGPFTGRLANSGESLRLVNNSGRTMDEMDYGDAGEWPVAPDGSGVSLAKRHAESDSAEARNWAASALVGGTPGAHNFPVADLTPYDRTLVPILADWKYEASNTNLGTLWRTPGYNDSAWSSGPALFYGGSATLDTTTGGQPPAGLATPPLPVANAGFEDGPLNPPPGIGPIEGWARGSEGSGNNDVRGPYNNGAPIPEGQRVGFIQLTGDVAQSVGGFTAGKRYTVQYFENERGSGGVAARAAASLGGVSVVPAHNLVRHDAYRRVVSQPFTATGPTATLALRNEADFGTYGDNAFLFDDVRVTRAVPAIASGGFEGHQLQPATFEYGPTAPGLGWTFHGAALSRNGSAFQGQSNASEGNQLVALQSTTAVSQTVGGFEVGVRYSVSWAEQRRTNHGNANNLQVVLDAGLPTERVIAAAHMVENGSFVHRTSDVFAAAKSSYTLTLRATNPRGGDSTTFIDDVRFNFVSDTPPLRSALPFAPPATHYFRKRFDFNDDAASVQLRLNAAVDDGAVFYLNGTEIYRHNMPGGGVTHGTPASPPVGNAGFTGEVPVPSSALLPGSNVLAVEVHQASPHGNDMVFGVELAATVTPAPPSSAPSVAFNEIAAATASPFAVELVNYGTTTLSIGGYALSSSAGGEYTFPAGQTLAAGAYLSFTKTQLGFATVADGDKLFLYRPGKTAVVDAVNVGDRHRGRATPGTGRWLFPSQPTFGAANAFALNNSIVINEIMYRHRPEQARAAVVQETPLIAIDSAWKYDQSGVDLGTDWRQRTFDDGSWPGGAGLLYVEDAALPASKNTPLTLGRNTYYFRKTFQISGPIPTELRLRHVVDDGAVFYLNGQRLDYAFNMPAGGVSYSTPASPGVDNAAYSGVITVPASALVQGTNVLAVEVHQSGPGSGDVVFGAELTAVVELSPALPYRESTEQWVELHNRSSQPVNLTGWRLDDAIDFAFPANTTIAPGGYLVVAKDAAGLRALHPSVPASSILGNFERELSGRSDNVLLRDAAGNPADEVRYFDNAPWPAYADGEGSSLELRDPNADNAVPEAWAASDESARSSWQTYTYRGVVAPEAAPSPNLWNEFVLGLMEAGEVLIDDVRVTDVASGAQLLQNTGFESGNANAWRIIGNQFGSVVTDPTNPNNKVLRLLATGPTEHMHNHAETTFSGNQAAQIGRQYEISFRARWLAGSNQFNTRLYFNKLPKKTLLNVPAQSGTPGAANSRRVNNAGPTFRDLSQSPAVPAPGQSVLVSAVVQDPQGVGSARLWYSVGANGTWANVPMAAGPGGRYAGAIPGQAAGTLVQFYVEATDTLGASATYPAKGPTSRALYKVDDGQAAPLGLHEWRILQTPADVELLYRPTNVMSNDRLGATVVYTGHSGATEVFHDVALRLKSGGYGRAGVGAGWNIRFNAGQLFRGVHETVAIDRGSGPFGGLGASQHELLFKHIANRSGGIPEMYDDVIHVIAPDGQYNGDAQLLTSRYEDIYLDSQFDNGADGMLYEFELIYYSTVTVDGNPQSLKLPPAYNAVVPLQVDIGDLGDDPESYRWNYLVKNQNQRDDYSRLIELAKAFSLPAGSAALDQRTQELMDVSEWMRLFAFESLTGLGDTYNMDLAHNFALYVRPEDNKVLGLPWDSDHAFLHSTDSPIFGRQNVNLQKVIALPGNRRLFYGHLLDLIDTTYNRTYLAPWVPHYGYLSGQDFTAGLLNYVDGRVGFVLGQLPAQVPFRITTNNGNNFTTDQQSVTLAGDAWIDVKEIRIAGRPDALALTWSDQDSWSSNVPLSNGPNALTFQAFDFHGNLIATDTITVTSTATGPNVLSDLRITEINYHPADPAVGSPYTDNDFEFIELQNIGASPLPIGGVRFAAGLDFTFPNLTLAPNQYVLVVRNRAAFESRYGAGLNVAGEFVAPTNLDNSGEPVRLETGGGQAILDFAYLDDDWHAAADGFGRSLVIRDARGAVSNWNVKEGWRPSGVQGGSPGADDLVPAPAVAGRHVFYNNSAFDAAGNDDAAIATDKRALLPGQSATFANYTSYSRGLNGVMIEVNNLPLAATPMAADFTFRTGNDNNPAAWAVLSTQPVISLRRGEGADGSDRVTLTWPDGAIKGKWLQVTVKATANTGLATPDVFYFGNAPGESGNWATAALVNSVDEAAARHRPRGASNPAAVTFNWDYNRDRLVNRADQLVARAGRTAAATALKLIDVPGAAGAAALSRAHFAASPFEALRIISPQGRDEPDDLLA